MDLVRQKVGNGLTKAEWDLFLYMAKLYELNPLLGEIWAVKFNGKPANIFTGRDGLLKIGHKSGMFDGMKTVLLIESEKKVWELDIAPTGAAILGAKCYVWRKDMRHPVEVSVKMSEYNTHRATWNEKPDTMIRKVAEAHALRRAFSIHGLYLPEEFKEAEAKGQQPTISPVVSQPAKEQETEETTITVEPSQASEVAETNPDDPKYVALPDSVRNSISSSLKQLIEKYADLQNISYLEARKKVLATVGVKKIEDMRYQELRTLYKALDDQLKAIA
jgi:phage recombination protein Bet